MLERFPRSVALTLQSVFDVQQLADSAPSADAANGDLTTAKRRLLEREFSCKTDYTERECSQ